MLSQGRADIPRLAFPASAAYNFATLVDASDVHVGRQICSRIAVVGAFPRRTNRARPIRSCELLDPWLAPGLRRQSQRRLQRERSRLERSGLERSRLEYLR